jgi:hypothetical protein
MKILLAGDSWGIGVFETRNGTYGPIGQGIQTILEGLGHTVTNISRAGGSNWLMVERLNGQWNKSDRCLFGVDPRDKKSFNLVDIDCVIFIQTDIFRERHYYGKQYEHSQDTKYKILEQEFVDSLLQYSSLQEFTNQYFTELYTALDNLHKPILCIGGWAKLHPTIRQFDNLIPVLYSATQLLIPKLEQDTYLSDPEWFLQLDQNTKIMDKFGSELKPLAIANSEKLDLIYQAWNEVHPNLFGYQTIVDRILPYLQKN